MEQPLTFADPAGRAVSGILASPQDGSGRLAVLCHGFLSNKNSSTNKALTALLVERGIATFRFDFFGQGDSEGPFERITATTAVIQTLAALDLMASRGYGRLGLMGSSFGGLIATLVAANQPAPQGIPLSALALKCPALDFPEILRLEFGEAGMDRWKRMNVIPNLTGGSEPFPLRFAFYEDCLKFDAYKVAESIRAPVLIVQGDRDESVPLHQSRRLFDAIRAEKRLELMSGADHRFSRPEDFQTMTRLLADWLTTHL
jgi:pimeloyl-ACP methyl ester carboxylesterase